LEKTVSMILLALLFSSMLTLSLNIQQVRADAQTIYINVDGSITPVGAPIMTSDKITYTFTGNISYPTYYGIIVERNNSAINGNGCMLQGNNSGTTLDFSMGLNLTDTSNVTINNVNIKNFCYGIYLYDSSNNTVSKNAATTNYVGIYLKGSSSNIVCGNNATTNSNGILLDTSSNNNTVSGNTATASIYDGIELWASSNNTISGNNATTNSDGIGLYSYSNNNTVSGNNATTNSNGILLDTSLYNTVSGNTVTTNSWGIVLEDYSDNDTVSGNTVTTNSYDGIELFGSSYNTVSGNIASANGDGIGLYDSSNSNSMYHNNFIGNVAQSLADPTSFGNTWDDGYPSGGNFWSDYHGMDLYSGPYQNQPGSDGIGDTPYSINANNIDHYPLMRPVGPIHYVVLTNVTLSRNGFWPMLIVGQGYSLNITVTAADPGSYAETFNVTAFANTTYIASQNVTTSSGNSTTITFTWNTTGFGYGTYTISAYAVPVPDQANTVNNNFTGGNVIVTIPGDINGDFKVNLEDVVTLAAAYGSHCANYHYQGEPASPNWNPNADINGGGKVGLLDLAILAYYWLQHYP